MLPSNNMTSDLPPTYLRFTSDLPPIYTSDVPQG